MGLIGSVRCEKTWSDFVERTFALIAPVHLILHRVSCSYETIPNAPKHYERLQNMSLWSNGVDRVRPLRKIPMWLRGTNFCINCTDSSRFAPSFMQLWNDPKCTEILQNGPKHSFRVQWGGLGVFVAKKIPTWLRATNFCINCTTSPHFAPSFMQLRKDPKCTRTLWNAPKHEFRAQWIGSFALVAKNPIHWAHMLELGLS